MHRGILEQEEEFLFNLRQEKEGEARRVLEQDVIALEEESKRSQVKAMLYYCGGGKA